jgi:hypothetical protein
MIEQSYKISTNKSACYYLLAFHSSSRVQHKLCHLAHLACAEDGCLTATMLTGIAMSNSNEEGVSEL